MENLGDNPMQCAILSADLSEYGGGQHGGSAAGLGWSARSPPPSAGLPAEAPSTVQASFKWGTREGNDWGGSCSQGGFGRSFSDGGFGTSPAVSPPWVAPSGSCSPFSLGFGASTATRSARCAVSGVQDSSGSFSPALEAALSATRRVHGARGRPPNSHASDRPGSGSHSGRVSAPPAVGGGTYHDSGSGRGSSISGFCVSSGFLGSATRASATRAGDPTSARAMHSDSEGSEGETGESTEKTEKAGSDAEGDGHRVEFVRRPRLRCANRFRSPPSSASSNSTSSTAADYLALADNFDTETVLPDISGAGRDERGITSAVRPINPVARTLHQLELAGGGRQAGQAARRAGSGAPALAPLDWPQSPAHFGSGGISSADVGGGDDCSERAGRSCGGSAMRPVPLLSPTAKHPPAPSSAAGSFGQSGRSLWPGSSTSTLSVSPNPDNPISGVVALPPIASGVRGRPHEGLNGGGSSGFSSAVLFGEISSPRAELFGSTGFGGKANISRVAGGTAHGGGAAGFGFEAKIISGRLGSESSSQLLGRPRGGAGTPSSFLAPVPIHGLVAAAQHMSFD